MICESVTTLAGSDYAGAVTYGRYGRMFPKLERSALPEEIYFRLGSECFRTTCADLAAQISDL